MTIWQLFSSGGVTLYVLIVCSILSLAVIIDRFLYYRKRSKVKRVEFMESVRKELERGKFYQALALCQEARAPFANVAHSGISLQARPEKEISNSMERAIVIEITGLEKFNAILGTIGSVAVYIGLFGTVLGIIRAFHDISASGASGVNVVISGISEALVCTAAGLAVAVPAVVAYNYFAKRVDNFITDMELCASEVLDLLNGHKK